MTFSKLPSDEIQKRLAHDGLCLKIGPFVVKINSTIPEVAHNVQNLYLDHHLTPDDFADFHVSLKASGGIRRFYKQKVNFLFDGSVPFKPLPYNQAFAFFEWGLNWCVANHAHHYFIVHAAVVEKGGVVVIMPGSPGAGKSTLCAALVNSGWRLFSDEMALIDPLTLNVIPIPRPISLKNDSIKLIQSRFNEAKFGLLAKDTHKGSICHMKPPTSSVERSNEPATAKWVIFPKYVLKSRFILNKMKKGDASIKLAQQGFNYNLLGEAGFDTLVRLVDQTETFELEYSSLDEAMEQFDKLC